MGRLMVIISIIRKDLLEFVRDKTWVFLTILSLAMFVTIYWLLPSTIDDSLNVGIYDKDVNGDIAKNLAEQEDINVIEFDSLEEMKGVIKDDIDFDEDVDIGFVFPEGFVEDMALEKEPTVQIYFHPSVSEELRNAMSMIAKELGSHIVASIQGSEDFLPVEFPDEDSMVLGEDRLKEEIPPRDYMKPFFIFFILMVESMALASLIAIEVYKRTINAIVVTSAKLTDVFLSKAIFGTLLAFVQALIIIFAIGSFEHNLLPIVVMVFLGATMVTGIAFIAGSAGKDFMGTLFYSVPFLIPLIIPSIAILFPGTVATWIKFLPSYGLIDGITSLGIYGDTLAETSGAFLMVIIWNIVIFSIGFFLFKWRIKNL